MCEYESQHLGTKLTISCDQCKYNATPNGSLKIHNQAKHEGVKNVCDKCDNKYALKHYLNEHIASMHEGLKYQYLGCDYLGRLQRIYASCVNVDLHFLQNYRYTKS